MGKLVFYGKDLFAWTGPLATVKIRREATVGGLPPDTVFLVCQWIRPQLELHSLACGAFAALDVPGSAGCIG